MLAESGFGSLHHKALDCLADAPEVGARPPWGPPGGREMSSVEPRRKLNDFTLTSLGSSHISQLCEDTVSARSRFARSISFQVKETSLSLHSNNVLQSDAINSRLFSSYL